MAHVCEDCGKRFGGAFVFERHLIRGRCRTVPELRSLGFTRDDADVWHRPAPDGQLVLFSARTFGSVCQRMFGKRRRDLTPEELRQYKRALAGDRPEPLRGSALADVGASRDSEDLGAAS